MNPPSPYNRNNNAGFSLVEALLAGALFTVLVTGIGISLLYAQEVSMTAGNRTRAAFLAEEGLEAVRIVRDDDFTQLTNGTFGATIATNQWQLSGSSDTNGIFTRTINVATVDADRKQVTSTVTWRQNEQRQGTVTASTYLTNWQKIAQTWGNPGVGGSGGASGSNPGEKVATQGNYAYTIHTGSPDFFIFDITNPASPVQRGSLSLSGNPQNIRVSGDYAYIASNDDNQELQVISIANPASPSLVGSYNIPSSTADVLDLEISGHYAYLILVAATGSDFYVIDITYENPSGGVSLDLGTGNNNEICILNNYAYIASADTSREIKRVDITNPNSPSLLAGINIAGSYTGRTIACDGNTVILGTSSNFFRLFNVTTKTSPVAAGTVTLNALPNDIGVGPNNIIFVATASATAGVQLVDITTIATPTITSSITTSGAISGIAYNTAGDVAVGVGSIGGNELFIFNH